MRTGPIIERRSIQGAESFTQHYAITYLPTADERKAALCYVSNEGLVLLPERIRQLLVELLTDEKFYDLYHNII
ncbi:MAG: hypothetical protein ABFS56_34835 [Pseudomonadota bacterium]